MELTVVWFIFLILLTPSLSVALHVGFYDQTCPHAEAIVQHLVHQRYAINNTVAPALIRMYFHDCYVRGCDASILIDPSNTNKETEKTAEPNLTIREFELIDKIKSKLEETCPQTVSCADIIALATRDAVVLSGGERYNVPTGRRDGLVSKASEANLPMQNITVDQALQAFTIKGLTLNDMVILLGAHSVGSSHCHFFRDRLFDFQGSGHADRTMNGALIKKLKGICGSMTSKLDPSVFLDQNTSFALDSEYYNQLRIGKGLLQIDQEISNDPRTTTMVTNMAASNAHFQQSFVKAMVKLGNVDVLQGTAGEIRTNCRAFNK
ncbi:peroxidase 57-like [Silene latifolia]|uniref:peroxidase 57-like n=1 Tax=Silene latifolia TaxID=37657 RepID=UPI003D778A9A